MICCVRRLGEKGCGMVWYGCRYGICGTVIFMIFPFCFPLSSPTIIPLCLFENPISPRAVAGARFTKRHISPFFGLLFSLLFGLLFASFPSYLLFRPAHRKLPKPRPAFSVSLVH